MNQKNHRRGENFEREMRYLREWLNHGESNLKGKCATVTEERGFGIWEQKHCVLRIDEFRAFYRG
jgi:hypothetical protein